MPKARKIGRRGPSRPPGSPGPATDVNRLLGDVRALIEAAREQTARAVNAALVGLYWHIGKRVREDVLREKRAESCGLPRAWPGSFLSRQLSSAEISASRSSLQPNVPAVTTMAMMPGIAIHQMCQIAAKPVIVAKKAVMKPVAPVGEKTYNLYPSATHTFFKYPLIRMPSLPKFCGPFGWNKTSDDNSYELAYNSPWVNSEWRYTTHDSLKVHLGISMICEDCAIKNK